MSDELQGIRTALNLDSIKKIPSVSGVYMFVIKKKPIYIGKAINLKARLLSHLENAKVDRKEKLIIDNADSLEYFETDSEFKALILESKLIQSHHPKYNVRWRDDKSFLYIKITKKEVFPKILMVRREKDPKAVLFGPFPGVRSVEEILSQVRRIFPFCSQKKIGKQPCFYSKIGLCNPCPSYINTVKDEKLKSQLKREYRKNISNIIKILSGKLDTVEKMLQDQLNSLTSQERYEDAIEVRNRLFNFRRLITQQLFDTREFSQYNNSEQALKDLIQILQNYLPSLTKLERIECYDISNLSQKEATGSMVVLTDGQADKSQYRKFKVKNPKTISDFGMLEEVIRRRFRNSWPTPDLIVVDGGKPQVRTVLRTLTTMDRNIPVLGIAKSPDRLILGTLNLPSIRPNLQRSGFNLVRFIRDESHRFARKYHLYLRDKKIYNKV